MSERFVKWRSRQRSTRDQRNPANRPLSHAGRASLCHRSINISPIRPEKTPYSGLRSVMVFAGWPTEPGGDYDKGAGRRGENAARRENRDNHDPEREESSLYIWGKKAVFTNEFRFLIIN